MFNEAIGEKVHEKYPMSRFDVWPLLQLEKTD